MFKIFKVTKLKNPWSLLFYVPNEINVSKCFITFFQKQRSGAIAMVQMVGGRQKGTQNVRITPLTLFNKGICCFGFVDQLYMYPRCEYNWILIFDNSCKKHPLFVPNEFRPQR